MGGREKRVHIVQLAALFLGVALFVWLLRGIGLSAILSGLHDIGWGLLVVIALELVVDAVNTLGWRCTFEPTDRDVSFAVLYLVRLAGSAFNQVFPTATVGGEPVKVMLLRGEVSTSSAWASVITAKLSFGLAQTLFVLCGFAVAFGRLELASPVRHALVAALALTILGLVLFLAWQRRGFFGAAAVLAERLGLSERSVGRLRGATAVLDSRIRDFYVVRRIDVLASIGWHLVSFAIGVFQVYLLLRWLDLSGDVTTCLAIEAFSLLIQLALFLVPSSIGVQEGGKVIVFTALGLPAAAGLTVGIAFRLTQIATIAAGLAAFGALQWRQRRALAASSLPG